MWHAASTALRTDIGRRSGLVGMVIQLARDLHLACEDNTELREALEGQKVCPLLFCCA